MGSDRDRPAQNVTLSSEEPLEHASLASALIKKADLLAAVAAEMLEWFGEPQMWTSLSEAEARLVADRVWKRVAIQNERPATCSPRRGVIGWVIFAVRKFKQDHLETRPP